MSRLEWDQVGERKFQAGLDRGVLYLPNVAVPWNGLTGVEEANNTKSQPYYQDGVKYMEHQVLGDFSATLKAFTYPDEFEPCIGIQTNGDGVFFHDQPGQPFGLSYRTLIGNDVSGLEHGYILHMMYNLSAIPSTFSYSTVGGAVAPMEFSWTLTCLPEVVRYIRPTGHVSVKSTDIDPSKLDAMESALYGYSGGEAYLPDVTAFMNV